MLNLLSSLCLHVPVTWQRLSTMSIPFIVSVLNDFSSLATLSHTSQLHFCFQSYFTAGGLQPISSSRRQAPWGSRPDLTGFVSAKYSYTYRTYSMLLKIFLVNLCMYSVSTVFPKQIVSIITILCYNSSLVTCAIVFTAAKFKPLIFSVWLPLFLWHEYVHSHDLYDFLLSAQFRCINIYIWKAESRVQFADRCAPRKISNDAENLVL
jgi:hypothetical protein